MQTPTRLDLYTYHGLRCLAAFAAGIAAGMSALLLVTRLGR